MSVPASHNRDINAMPAVDGSGTAILQPSAKPIELSFPLPKAPETKIHLRLTINTACLVVFLTTVSGGDIPIGPPLGSFVCALPDRNNPGQTLSTPLIIYESSLEFTTRIANLLAKTTQRPVYVGNSMSFTSAGMGGTIEEEIEGFKRVLGVILGEVQRTAG